MTIEYPLIQRPKRCLFGPARSCLAGLSILRQWRCCTNRNLKCKCGSIWFQARFFFSLPLFQNRSVSNDIVNKALQIAGILSGGYNWQIVMFISIQHAIPLANSFLPFRLIIITINYDFKDTFQLVFFFTCYALNVLVFCIICCKMYYLVVSKTSYFEIPVGCVLSL